MKTTPMHIVSRLSSFRFPIMLLLAVVLCVNIFNRAPSWYTVSANRRKMSEVYGARLSMGVSGRF